MTSEAAHSRKSRLAVPSGGDPLANPAPRSSVPAANRPMQYFQRLTDVRQMDIQSALDQMKTLISTRPQVVYKTSYYRKQTKNHWARDDPAFLAMQGVFLIVAGIAYSVAFRISLQGAISFLLYTVLWNWLGLGLLIATICREIANRQLVVQQSSSHVRQQVEWLYAFDIHCNSFFPVFILLCKLNYVIQSNLTLCDTNERVFTKRRGPIFPAPRHFAGRAVVSGHCQLNLRRCFELVLVHYAFRIQSVTISISYGSLFVSNCCGCGLLLCYTRGISAGIRLELGEDYGSFLFHVEHLNEWLMDWMDLFRNRKSSPP